MKKGIILFVIIIGLPFTVCGQVKSKFQKIEELLLTFVTDSLVTQDSVYITFDRKGYFVIEKENMYDGILTSFLAPDSMPKNNYLYNGNSLQIVNGSSTDNISLAEYIKRYSHFSSKKKFQVDTIESNAEIMIISPDYNSWLRYYTIGTEMMISKKALLYSLDWFIYSKKTVSHKLIFFFIEEKENNFEIVNFVNI